MKKPPCIIIVVALLIGCSRTSLTQQDSQTSTQTSREVSQPTAKDAPQDSDEIDVTFTGIVKNVEMMGQRETTAFLAGFDSRFLIFVKVLSVSHSKTPVTAGKEVRLAIHSPALLFGWYSDDAVGKKYQFTARWGTDPWGMKRFSGLRVKLLEEDK